MRSTVATRGLLFALTLTLSVSTATADYILTPTLGGMSSAEVAWGDSFTLDFILSSDAFDEHNSAIFQVIFTEPGLQYDAYDWASPYGEGDVADQSVPFLTDLPMVVDVDAYTNPISPTLVDIQLDNVLLSGTHGAGDLVALDLTVPMDIGFVGSIYIYAQPDSFYNGFTQIPTTAGQVFELIVTPEPTTALMLAALVLIRRR